MMLLLLACTGDGDTGATTGYPAVAFVQPTDEAVVCGAPLAIEVQVENFELVEPVENPEDALPGTGHLDIALNGQEKAMVWDTTTTLDQIEDGVFQLKVELSGADHEPVEPYTADLIYITVDATECS